MNALESTLRRAANDLHDALGLVASTPRLKVVTFSNPKLGLTLQRDFFSGRALVVGIEEGEAAQSAGVEIGDEVVTLAGGIGSGFPLTPIPIESYDQLMKLYRSNGGRRPLILTFSCNPKHRTQTTCTPQSPSALDDVVLTFSVNPARSSAFESASESAMTDDLDPLNESSASTSAEGSLFRRIDLNYLQLEVKERHREVKEKVFEVKEKLSSWIERTRGTVEQEIGPGASSATPPRNDDETAEIIREQSKRQWRNLTRVHLERFLACKPQAQYEDWLVDLHPEKAWRDIQGNPKASLIDERFFFRSSDHLAIWNRVVSERRGKNGAATGKFARMTLLGMEADLSRRVEAALSAVNDSDDDGGDGTGRPNEAKVLGLK